MSLMSSALADGFFTSSAVADCKKKLQRESTGAKKSPGPGKRGQAALSLGRKAGVQARIEILTKVSGRGLYS